MNYGPYKEGDVVDIDLTKVADAASLLYQARRYLTLSPDDSILYQVKIASPRTVQDRYDIYFWIPGLPNQRWGIKLDAVIPPIKDKRYISRKLVELY